MGSSVFHGGFSTFLAISCLAGSKSYVFVVFYKLWFGIIVFGMSNGFLLLPVLLSYMGPVDEPHKSSKGEPSKSDQVSPAKIKESGGTEGLDIEIAKVSSNLETLNSARRSGRKPMRNRDLAIKLDQVI